MSFFPPIPAVLAIAALNRQRLQRPQRPKAKAVPTLPAPIDIKESTAVVAEEPVSKATVQPMQRSRRRVRTMNPQNITQRANALSDIAMYMGGGNPRAAQMAQTFKVMSMLNQPPQAQVQTPMTQQERTMGLLKSMGSLMGNTGGMPPILNMLTGGGGGGPGGLLSMLGGGGAGGLGSLLSLIGGARNLGPLMSMLGGRGQKSGVQPLPANMMDRVNSMLAGMDESKKEELLNMARSLLQNNNSTS